MLLSARNRRQVGFNANFVAFKGATYLRRTAVLSNATPDIGTGFIAAQIKLTGDNGTNMELMQLAAVNIFEDPGIRLQRTASNNFYIAALKENAGNAVTMISSANYTNQSGVINILASWNTATSTRHLYINDASDLVGGSIEASALVRWAEGRSTIGASNDGTDHGEFETSLIVAGREYIDFSVEANRRKFFDASGNMVDIGSDGSTPTGTQPVVYFGGTQKASDWNAGTNKGNGGIFETLSGAVVPTTTILRGATPNFINTTVADWYVDGLNGSDSNDGLTPGTAFATIPHAVAQADGTTKGRICVMPTTVYRETVSFDNNVHTAANPIRLSGYGAGRPEISGAEILTGWTQCTDDEGGRLSSGSFSNIYKATILAADKGPIAPHALNIHEAGVFSQIAIVRSTNLEKLFRYDVDTWLVADSVQVDGSNNITGYTDADVFNNYTALQLTNSKLLQFGGSNRTTLVDITGKPTATSITTSQDLTYSPGDNENRYSLINVLPAMVQGQFGAIEEGNGDITVYLWPNNVANLTSGIEYSKRVVGINIGNCDHVYIEGITVKQTSGSGGDNGIGIGHNTDGISTPRHENVTIRECIVEKIFAADEGYGAIYLGSTNDALVERNTCRQLPGHPAYFMQRCSDGHVDSNIFEDFEYSGLRNYGAGTADPSNYSQRMVHSFNKFKGGCRETHANKGAVYQGSDKVLVFGNEWEDCHGYLTFQASSNIYFGHNLIPISNRDATTGSNRGLVDQTGDDPVTDNAGEILAWNNMLVPNPLNLSVALAMVMGGDGNTMTYKWFNNIYHGGGRKNDPAVTSVFALQRNNVITQSSVHTDNSDVFEADPYSVWIDPTVNDDLVVNGPGGLQGYDGTTDLATAMTHFPNFNFSQDIDKNAITLSNVKAGVRDPGFTYPQAVPDAFTELLWSVIDSATADAAEFTVSSLPNDNNSTISRIESQIDGVAGGAWIDSGIAAPGTFLRTDLADGNTYNTRLRAVNLIGNAPAGDTKSVELSGAPTYTQTLFTTTDTTTVNFAAAFRDQLDLLYGGTTQQFTFSIWVNRPSATGSFEPVFWDMPGDRIRLRRSGTSSNFDVRVEEAITGSALFAQVTTGDLWLPDVLTHIHFRINTAPGSEEAQITIGNTTLTYTPTAGDIDILENTYFALGGSLANGAAMTFGDLWVGFDQYLPASSFVTGGLPIDLTGVGNPAVYLGGAQTATNLNNGENLGFGIIDSVSGTFS